MLANVIKKLLRLLALTMLGLLFMLLAVLMVIYSSWGQDAIRQSVVEMMNRTPGTEFRLDKLRIYFPLDIEAAGMSWVQDGDTMMAVGRFNGSIRTAELFDAVIDITEADLYHGVYNLGNTDSATMIRLHADTVHLSPARLSLSPMDIVVEDGSIAGGHVSIWLNPDPPKSPTDTAATNPMTVNIKKLDLRQLDFEMQMMPSIDSLGMSIGRARLCDGLIDLAKQTISIDSFTGNRLNVVYLTPDSAAVANTPVAQADTTASGAPWQVRVGQLAFDHSSALYAGTGYEPMPGLDFGYIQLSDLSLEVTDFYNCASTVDVPLAIHGTERCGVELSADGTLHVTEAALAFDDFTISTRNGTKISAEGSMGMGDMATDPSIPIALNVSGALAVADARLMFPVMKPYLLPFGDSSSLGADLDVAGTMGSMRIARMHLNAPGVFDLEGRGSLNDVMQPEKLGGDLAFEGSIGTVDPWVKLLMPTAGIAIPSMDLTADVHIENGAYAGTLNASTSGGDVSLDGSFNGKASDYDICLSANRFPVAAFMPELGIGALSADLSARGHGFDLASDQTFSDIELNVSSLEYQGVSYSDIHGVVALKDGHADYDIESNNSVIDFALKGTAEIGVDRYSVNAIADARKIDLYTLQLSETEGTCVEAYADINASFDSNLSDVAAMLTLNGLRYASPIEVFEVDDVKARLLASDSVTNVSVRNSDLFAYFSSPLGLDSLLTGFGNLSPVIDAAVSQHQISATALQQALPPFNLMVDGGSNNAVTQVLAGSKMGLKRLSLTATNDSLINVSGRVLQFTSPTMRLDTITLDINQHGERLDYLATVNNRPGSFDAWAHVKLSGYIDNDKVSLALNQQNIKGQTGFDIGSELVFAGDSMAVLTLLPLDPTIGYSPWTVNEGNYVSYNFTHNHIDANLRMQGMGSHLNLYSEHAESTDADDHNTDEALVVDVAGVKIQDWISINPFAPSMKGEFGANMRVFLHESELSGSGTVTLDDFVYGKEHVGDFKADLSVLTNSSGLMTADMALFVNGEKSVTLKGALNDSTQTSPFNLDLTMIHFPLQTANAFLPGIATLSGTINGSMDVSGKQDEPKLNGWLQFDSASVAVTMIGSTFTISDTQVPVENNVVRFNDFKIHACNDNPLTINGDVDISDFENLGVNLTMNANNMQIVNTSRAPKGADVYGKAFVDFNAGIQGAKSLFRVDANVSVLSATNLTYIFEDAETAIQSQSTDDMVKFVNFADTVAVNKADSIAEPQGMRLILQAGLNMQNGSTVNVELGAGSSNRVQIKPQGQLSYAMTPLDDGRLTGRLNINSGYVRYTPPMMSQKVFNFQEGSYVAFTGDMMNPLLNIHAVDQIRANVTSTGQNSRLIDFDLSLAVTGSLSNMDVAFDLSTDDDATVANELASMSESQRASTAMNMLVTNMYTAGETKADANLGGNALYSFLSSQLNSWAANAIKGVDLSFGINQYDNVVSGNSQQTTSYSYRVSKSLFNDRVKIVVGGNYSTDANADENLSQNLVNDISIEYMLNAQGTMQARIFRHTGYESILEGEITQTGVGFVYKRKLSTLRNLFRFHRRRSSTSSNTENVSSSDSGSAGLSVDSITPSDSTKQQ